ncbi:IscS subfamily cysteine desulfurase [Flavihumibacter sp. RY-1]|uniref:cysteine desulfurase n=1 Tax=Flavihumibacter fluminis TaxID=2909236 RepID=A0ABS9BNF2_9BACT|nr:IscS subfamily cysteine desulfurase [Flavihumibacter fluminis]MCF1716587.1 IscS subfamily cysteine desulfurase [Flavihumibacter fluminis]
METPFQVPVYLDNNATTPMDPRVLEAMMPYFTKQFGNAASRSHAYGWAAEEAVELAREQVARLIGAIPQEIVFTSGATEGVNLAIKGVAEMYTSKGNHIITCQTEHKAVIDTCKHLEKKGLEITWLPVDATGMINLQELEAAIRPTTILIAIMYANNETGVIHPVREIGAIAKKHGVLFFTDATQAAGKIPVDVETDHIDILTLSAHKIYGPKGAGAVYVRRRDPRVRLTAQMDGGGHERGMRSGTLNVPGIVGLGKAADLCRLEMEAEAARLTTLRNRLQEGILSLPGVVLNGHPSNRLPHTLNISFPDRDSNSLLLQFNKKLALSAGSACTSATLEPSYVLKAMGFSDERSYSALRFGLGRFTTEAEIEWVRELFRQELGS